MLASEQLHPWLRHHRHCVVAVAALPESEHCTCGLSAVLRRLRVSGSETIRGDA